MRFHRLIGSSILVLTAAAGGAHAQETTTYQYDALGRLVQASASRGSSSATSSYTLDAAGNRTNVAVVASGTPTPGASCVITIPPGSTIMRYPLDSLSIYGAESLEFYVNFTVVSGAATLTKPQATIWLNAD